MGLRGAVMVTHAGVSHHGGRRRQAGWSKHAGRRAFPHAFAAKPMLAIGDASQGMDGTPSPALTKRRRPSVRLNGRWHYASGFSISARPSIARP